LKRRRSKVNKEPQSSQMAMIASSFNPTKHLEGKSSGDMIVEKKLVFLEQLELTRLMADFGDLVDKFYASLALQFGYIVFFGVYFPLGPFLLLIADIFIMGLTAFAYSDHIKRSKSIESNSIGVWNQIFNSVGYLGVIYNGVIPIFPGNGLIPIFGSSDTVRDLILILTFEHVLVLFKALIGMIVNDMPLWVINRIKKERYLEERHQEKIIFDYKKVKAVKVQAKHREHESIFLNSLEKKGGIMDILTKNRTSDNLKGFRRPASGIKNTIIGSLGFNKMKQKDEEIKKSKFAEDEKNSPCNFGGVGLSSLFGIPNRSQNGATTAKNMVINNLIPLLSSEDEDEEEEKDDILRYLLI